MCAAAGHSVSVGPSGTRFTAVHRFDEIDSTNSWLLERARAGDADGTVVVAAYQRAGRGRLDRRWEAPPGANLLVSVLLRPRLGLGDLHLCTAAVALAAADAGVAVAGVQAELKWPNDLVVGERKLAGVLAESLPDHDRPAVVVGLGLNVGWPAPDGRPIGATGLPGDHPEPSPELLGAATSLWRESATPAPPDVDAVLDAVLAGLEPRLADLETADGRRRVMDEYRRRCATLGRQVRVDGHDESLVGLAVDVDDAGHLVLQTPEGRRRVAAGDVVHLRDEPDER